MTPPPEAGPGLTGQQAATALQLAEAVAAMVCHDLSGPLGTLLSALELVQDEPAAAEEALLLARQAADRMGKRLRPRWGWRSWPPGCRCGRAWRWTGCAGSRSTATWRGCC